MTAEEWLKDLREDVRRCYDLWRSFAPEGAIHSGTYRPGAYSFHEHLPDSAKGSPAHIFAYVSNPTRYKNPDPATCEHHWHRTSGNMEVCCHCGAVCAYRKDPPPPPCGPFRPGGGT